MSGIQWGYVPVPLSGGLDTKTDERRVAAPALLEAENVVLRAPGQVAKRPGRKLAAIAGPESANRSLPMTYGVGARGDELVAFANGQIFSLTGQDLGLPLSGSIRYAAAISHLGVTSRMGEVAGSAGVVANGARFVYQATSTFGYTYHLITTAAALLSYYWIVDDASGAIVRQMTAVPASMAQFPRLIAVGDYVVLMGSDGANSLFAYAWRESTYGSAAGSGTLLGTTTTTTATPLWDGVAMGDRLLVVYPSSTANTIYHGLLNPASLAAFVTQVAQATVAGTVQALTAIPRDPNLVGNYAVAWSVDVGATEEVYAREFDSTGAAVAAAQTLLTGATEINQITGAWGPGEGSLTAKYYIFIDSGPSYTESHLYMASFVGATVVAAAVQQVMACIRGRAWTDYSDNGTGGSIYVPLGRETRGYSPFDQLQPSLLVYRLGFALGTLNWSMSAILSYGIASETEGAVVGARSILDGGVQQLPLGRTRLAVQAIGQLREYTIDHRAAPSFVVVDGVMYIAGGLLQEYDGSNVAENGFPFYPEGMTLTPSNGAGALTPSVTYTYRVYFHRRSRGGTVKSGSITFTVVMGAADDTVTFSIEPLAFTAMRDTSLLSGGVEIRIFRSEANKSDLLYLVGSVANDPTSTSTLAFTDLLADSAIIGEEQDYLSSEPQELINTGLPACGPIAESNGRVFVAIDQQIYFSKLREHDVPLSFAGENQITLQAGDGPITAMAPLGDALAVFRARQTLILGGSGPDNTGGGGYYDDPVLVSPDIGAVSHVAVCRTTVGVVFRSHKGIMLLGQGGEISNIGAKVDGLIAGQDVRAIVAASLDPEVYVVFDDFTLVFNYELKAWSYWGIGGVSACLWRDQLTLLDDYHNGYIYQMSATSFIDEYADEYGNRRDASYRMKITTPWLAMAGLAGAERVRRVLITGEYVGSHRPKAWFRFDGETNRSYGPYEWDPTTTIEAGGRYSWEIRLPRQRFTSLSITIEDSADGDDALANSFTVTEIALEAGIMPAQPVRLPTTRMGT